MHDFETAAARVLDGLDQGYTQAAAQARKVNWPALLWKLVTLPGLGVLYWIVNAEGLRLKMPVLGTPLWKLPIPGASFLRDYEGLHRIDLAHVFAVFLLFAVWYLWVAMLRLVLFGKKATSATEGMNAVVHDRIVLAMGLLLTTVDAAIFFFGVAEQTDPWMQQQGDVPVVAVLTTVAYVVTLIFVSFVYVKLEASHRSH